MAYKGPGAGQKVQKVMVQPINLIFRYLQNRSRIQVWLYEQVNTRIEGCIVGFDEYMNLVLDEAEEVHMKTQNRKRLGRIMLKGDNITLIQQVQGAEGEWAASAILIWTVFMLCVFDGRFVHLVGNIFTQASEQWIVLNKEIDCQVILSWSVDEDFIYNFINSFSFHDQLDKVQMSAENALFDFIH